MAERINKLYKPSEIEDVKSRLKDILSVWDNRKPEDMLVQRSQEDWIILALHKQGYRIVKV